MKKLFYGFFCFVFLMLALSASAQEAPPTSDPAGESTIVASEVEQTDTVESESVDESATDESISAEEVTAEPESVATSETGSDTETIVEAIEESTIESTDDEVESTDEETDGTVEPTIEATDESTVEETDSVTSESTEESTDEPVSEEADESVDETTTEQTATETPDILISEINWAGSELSQADEWIELYNATSQGVDLGGWILTGSATSSDAIAFESGTMLAAFETLLISNYNLGSEKTTIAVQPDLVSASLSLSNSSQEIMLAMTDGTVVDVAGDGGSPLAGSTNPKASMYRDLDTLEWLTSEININLNSADQFGTPGTVSTFAEPAEPIPASLILNEFVSDPNEDEQEWIEVYNATDSTVDLTDWSVRDATEKSTSFDQESVSPGEYAVVYSPLGQLNNGGDTVELTNPEGEVISAVTYNTDEVENPGKGYSLAFIDGVWVLTDTPTPGSENIALVVQEEATETDVESGATDETTVEDASESETVDETVIEDEADEIADESEVAQTDETEESDEVVTETSEPLAYESGAVIITEIVSNPAEGDVEWIELFNAEGNAIDLTDWTVTDATERATTLEGSIEAGSCFVIEEPSGQLNNGGDSIFLYDPAGNLIDSMSYGSEEISNPDKGESLALIDTVWTITTEITKSTPNRTNYESEEIESEQEAAPASQSVSTSTQSGTHNTNEHQDVSNDQQEREGNDDDISDGSTNDEPHRVIAIVEAPAVANSTSSASSTSSTSSKTSTSTSVKKTSSSSSSKEITISGTVTATPGMFGSQIAFIEGMQLYFYHADWPMLDIGDVVTVTGEQSESRGEKRLKLSETGDIQITGYADLHSTEASINDLGVIEDGTLVTISGEITDMNSTKIVLTDTTGNIIVVASSDSNIQWNALSSELMITGIVRTVSDEQRIYIRSAQDIVQIQEEIVEEAQDKASDEAPAVTARSKDITPWVGGGLLLAALAGIIYFFTRREPLKTAPAGA